MKRAPVRLGRAITDVTDVAAKGEAPVVKAAPAVAHAALVPVDTALVVTPHPMTVQGQRVYNTQAALLAPGETLAHFLARFDVRAGEGWVVELGGVAVPEVMWTRVRPKHGHLIEARHVARKDVLRVAAIIAIAYFTLGQGGAAAGTFLGLQGTLAYAAAAVAYVAGTILVNRLLGPEASQMPERVNNTQSPSYSLTGGRNRLRPFEPMGLVLGEPYCVPDLAAQAYTYPKNGEQFLHQIFHAGVNCGSLDSIRIGQTAIANYSGVSLLFQGLSNGDTALTNTNVDTVAGGLLDAPGGPGAFVLRTSSAGAVALAVDIDGTLFATSAETGAFEANTVSLTVEYRALGSPTWLPWLVYGLNVGPGLMGSAFGSLPDPGSISNADTKPLRRSFWLLVVPGQYEVRMRKNTANDTATNRQNAVQWSQLRSFQADTGNYAGQARVACDIQASGQLNGALDEVNWVATMKPCPCWNGAAWVTASNRATGLCNPGALMLLLARGVKDSGGRLLAGLGYADAQIDIEGFKGFMARCAAKSFSFDYFLQETISIGDLMDAIAAAGMGFVSYHTGKYGVAWYSETDPVECVINMAAMKAKSFSVDYYTGATADEVEYAYFDRARNYAWKSVRVVAPGVTVVTATGTQRLMGVTGEVQAAQLARFSMAQNTYQRKSVSCDMDLEHLTFRRGTVIALSHDVTQWGYGGRITAAVNNAGTVTLTLDDLVPAVSPAGAISRYIGLRLRGEKQYRIFPVASFAGSSRTVTLNSAWPGGVAVPGDNAANPAMDSVWIYDFKATPGQKLRVTEIQPQGNMDGARVVMVPESSEFWDYVWTGAYTPPPNNSLLQGAPVASALVVSEQLALQGSTFYTELTLTFSVAGNFDHAELWGAIGLAQKTKLGETRNQRVSWTGGLSETWSLELRPYSSVHTGVAASIIYTVLGKTAPPANVGGFSFAVEKFGVRLMWNQGVDIDLDRYELRIDGGSWESALLLTSVGASSLDYLWKIQVSGARVIRIKAFDTSGNVSVLATALTVTLQAPAAPPWLTGVLSGADLVMMWGIPASDFAVDRYEIRYGASWAAGAFVDTTKATGYRVRVDYSGARVWWVAAVDVAGNTGEASSLNVQINLPGAASGQRAEVVDNNALLYWSAPLVGAGQLPIDHYDVRKGPTWAGGATVGSNGNSTFTTVFEQASGLYLYWIAAVDTQGGVGTPVNISATVNQPPDYVLRNNYDSPLSGAGVTLTNLYAADGVLLGPVDISKTWATHFTSNAWSTPADQIAAGFPIYAEPSVSSGSYEEVIDYLAAIPPTVITATLNSMLLAGAVAVVCTISWKLNLGDAWTVLPAGATALLPQFRYVRINYTFTCTAGANLIQISALNVKLAVKLRTASGAGTAAIGGTAVLFSATPPFVSADTPIAQPNGATPLIPVVIYTGGINPTGFTVRLYNLAGVDVGGNFSWTARGY